MVVPYWFERLDKCFALSGVLRSCRGLSHYDIEIGDCDSLFILQKENEGIVSRELCSPLFFDI